jgi:hypothetical protein
MIPAKSGVVVEDKAPSLERVKFGISDERKMMKMGARQYSDPIMAVIRELYCNGWDAQVEAGTDNRPVEITLPTIWDNTFVVQDYGSGMSRDIFREVYTQFGFSTKEHTNDQTGSLGLGSKSPLAYAETFSVSSVKNGWETGATVTREADWSVYLDIDWHNRTDKPNGTRIEIEVLTEHVPEFEAKARDLFKFQKPGQVKVRKGSDGDWFEVEHYAGEQIGENMYEALDWNLSWIVMGNVPYRIVNSRALFSEARIKPMNFVAYVPMSEEEGIDFTPSREDLEYTNRTKNTLRRVIKDFEEQMLAEAEAELDGATTHAEAYAIWTKWTEKLGAGLFADLEFQGDKFENTFEIRASRYDTAAYRSSTYTIDKWQIRYMENTLIITGFPSELNSGHKKKVREWSDHVGWAGDDSYLRYILFTGASKVDSPWVDQHHIVTWEKVKEEAPKPVKVPREKGSSGRPPGSWDYYTIAGRESAKPLPTKGKVFYVMAHDVDKDDWDDIPSKIRALGDDNTTVIRMGLNRLAKFQRENPNVKEFLAYAKSKVNMKPKDLLSDDAKAVMSLSWEERQLLERLDENEIKDPEFKRLKNLVKNQAVLTKKYEAALVLARAFGLWYTVEKYETNLERSPMHKRYPLLSRLNMHYNGYQNKADVYLYMNAKYAQLKKEKKV